MNTVVFLLSQRQVGVTLDCTEFRDQLYTTFIIMLTVVTKAHYNIVHSKISMLFYLKVYMTCESCEMTMKKLMCLSIHMSNGSDWGGVID